MSRLLAIALTLGMFAPAPLDATEQTRPLLVAAGEMKGGLIAHVGCGDGRTTVAMAEAGCFLVHGLDTDEANVEVARALFRSRGLHGRVSAELWKPGRLPYADDLVNLLIVENPDWADANEMLRVLRPGGAACIRRGEIWQTQVKPRSRELGEWTHYLYDASNNAVSPDTLVGPPERMQWIALTMIW